MKPIIKHPLFKWYNRQELVVLHGGGGVPSTKPLLYERSIDFNGGYLSEASQWSCLAQHCCKSAGQSKLEQKKMVTIMESKESKREMDQ